MGAIASLANRVVAVDPGGSARVEIKVRNNGTVVDQMTLSVLGEAAAWSRVEPESLSLFPAAEGTATVIFEPPRASSVPAGQLAFGVRVASGEDPAGSVVEEGRLQVGHFSEVTAELKPHTSRGSRGARHDLAVDNRGNVPLNATVSGTDKDELLAFDAKPPSVVAEPGHATFSSVDVRARKRFLRGQPVTRPFQLHVQAAGQAPVTVDGTLLQEPVLPPWFLKALMALAALLVALLALWFLVLQPAVLTAAEERAEDVLAAAGVTPGGGAGGGANGGGANGGGGGGGATAPPVVGPESARDGRIRAGGQEIRPSEGKALFITDLVFSNPAAETGPLQLRRNDDELLVLRLENFRDLDFHFVTPIVFGPGDRLRLTCDGCDQAGVYYSGYER